MSEKTFRAGEIIFNKGDFADSFFQILSGSVEVILGEGEKRKTLTELGPGRFFGEMAVLEGYPRSATVAAKEDGTRLQEISSGELNAWFRENPDMILSLMKHLSARTRELTKEYQDACALRDELQGEGKKDAGMMSRIARFLGLRPGAADAGRPGLETRLQLKNKDLKTGFAKKVNAYPAGTVLFREGEHSGCMYGVHWGSVGIYTGYGTADQRKITELFPDSFFGEMGMIDGEPRSATAVTLEQDTTIEVIAPEDLEELFEKNPVKVWMIFAHLSNRLRNLTRDFEKVCGELDALKG